jgi:hypothetical protein
MRRMRFSLHWGWSQSITTTANRSPANASSGDCWISGNLGLKPFSSTSNPNSAATTSSRARINTLPTARQPSVWTDAFGNLRTPRSASAGESPLRYLGTNVHPPPPSQRVRKTICSKNVSPLTEATIEELRSALTEQLRHPDAPTPEMSDLLRRVGREARENGVQPEELLVTFKQLWNSLSESLSPRVPDQYERVRENLVTLCIRAYYA